MSINLCTYILPLYLPSLYHINDPFCRAQLQKSSRGIVCCLIIKEEINMNNKHLISTLVILAMAGCASYTKPIDKDVLKQNKISYTLDIYNIYEGKNLNNISSIKKRKSR